MKKLQFDAFSFCDIMRAMADCGLHGMKAFYNPEGFSGDNIAGYVGDIMTMVKYQVNNMKY